MAEYIEREPLYRFLTEQKGKETGAYSKGRNAGLNVARSALHNKEITPAADVVEVVHGRWKKEVKHGWCWYVCSECGEEGPKTKYKNNWLSNFCPNCGADMREEEGHER